MIQAFKYLLIVIPGLFILSSASGQSILGKWTTIDDETNEEKSVVEIFEKDGAVYGKIVKLFRKPNEDPDPTCTECQQDDDRYNKKVLGMEIIRGLNRDGDEYSGGNIMDPKIGRVYRCKLWLEDEKLKVRGYWGPFYRTQTWHRSR